MPGSGIRNSVRRGAIHATYNVERGLLYFWYEPTHVSRNFVPRSYLFLAARWRYAIHLARLGSLGCELLCSHCVSRLCCSFRQSVLSILASSRTSTGELVSTPHTNC